MFQKRYVGSSAMIADEAPLSRRRRARGGGPGDVCLGEEDARLPIRVAANQPTRWNALIAQIRGGFRIIACCLCITVENLLFLAISRGFLHFSESYVALDKSFCMKLAKPMQVCVPPGSVFKVFVWVCSILISLCMPDANTSIFYGVRTWTQLFYWVMKLPTIYGSQVWAQNAADTE
jgi:hypothetical protein